MARKLRMGMVGGGNGAFIGAVHRMAATLDGQIALVCGAFSSSPENSKATGKTLFLEEDRTYGSVEEMLAGEKSLPESKRMDFVSIVTPNFLHYLQAKAILEAGFHVVCDKPITITIAEAEELLSIAKRKNLLFCLTHNYTGYPLVKQAKYLVQTGSLGKIRKVVVEYHQGWLSSPIETSGQKQASWRTDPAKAGISCCMGDIGSHAENLLEYITGLEITSLCADLSTFVESRTLDDDSNVLLRLSNGAKGVLFASQIASGDENELKIRVYGEKGSLEWLQSSPNELIVKWNDKPTEIQKPGVDKAYLCEEAKNACRLPSGHPEGYIEAFANLYKAFAATISENKPVDFPTIEDGIRGLRFIENCVKSSKQGSIWVKNN